MKVDLGRLLEINPIKVACLAAKEKVNPKMPATVDGLALKNLGEDGYFGESEKNKLNSIRLGAYSVAKQKQQI